MRRPVEVTSLINHSGVRFDKSTSKDDDTPIQSKYREMGEWLLDVWVPENEMNDVITESHKNL